MLLAGCAAYNDIFRWFIPSNLYKKDLKYFPEYKNISQNRQKKSKEPKKHFPEFKNTFGSWF